MRQLFRTIPVRAKFTEDEALYWQDQCQHANSLINCALYEVRQKHFESLHQKQAYTTYWKADELKSGWKPYKVETNYYDLDKILKQNGHYKALHSQVAQQTLMNVGESLTSYNSLVDSYYQGEVDRPTVPRYRKSGGLAAVVFLSQALQDWDGQSFRVGMSESTKPEAKLLGQILFN